MRRKTKTLRVRRTVAVAILIALAAALATAFSTGSQLAVLRARVLFLERALSGGLNEAELQELETRLAKLSPTPQSQRLTAILQRVAELERSLDRPVVVSAEQLSALKNNQVYLVGVVTRVTVKEKNLFLNINDVFAPIWGGANIPVSVGDLVALSGKVTEYQGELEVTGSPNDLLILEKR